MGEAKRVSTDDLIRAIRGTNPFRSNRVSSPEDVRVDVGQVHGAAFTRLTNRIEEVRRDRAASGILVVGAPGTGKSHLLGRLSRWARDNAAAFVFLHNLQASPERMPRYVLKATISAVFAHQQGGQGPSGLFKLLLHAMGRHEESARDKTDPVDPEIAAVLDAFARVSSNPSRASLVEAAIDWLSGDEIDEEQAKELGAVAGRKISVRLADGAAVERVLIVLANLLALDDKMLVLCLDQIDNLDADQVRALMAFLHALIDHAHHLVVICAGVNSNIYQLRDQFVISPAAWDRVAEHFIELQEVTSDHAHGLIAARTKDFLEPFAGLKALDAPRKRDPMFPLGQAWFQTTFGEKLQVRPRDVVSWAREEWTRVQQDIEAYPGGAAKWIASWPGKDAGTRRPQKPSTPSVPLQELVDQVVQAKVEEARSRRMLNSGSLPPDTDNLGRLTGNLLARCVGRSEYSLLAVEPQKLSKKKELPAFEFLIREKNGRGREVATGVACLPGGHANASTNALKRIKEYTDSSKPKLDHILIVTDDRREFRLGEKGKKIYRELERSAPKRFRHIRLSLSDVVELDALDSVVAIARVGDLEVEYPPEVPRPVGEEEAVESMHRQGLLIGHPFLHELLTEDDGIVPDDVPGRDPLEDSQVRGCITDFLPWRYAAHATEVTDKLLEDHPAADRPSLLRQVVRIADMMHVEGQLQVTPLDQDRHLLWTGGTA